MINIIVAFPVRKDAETIRTLLIRSGCTVSGVCVSGAAVLQAVDHLYAGVIVCGARLQDMTFRQLREQLPEGSSFPMLLIGTKRAAGGDLPEGVTFVETPLKVHMLLDAVHEAGQELNQVVSAGHSAIRRSSADRQTIALAKEKLMEKNNMTEEEAHRYLQKTSMDNGTNMTETAQMILSLMTS